MYFNMNSEGNEKVAFSSQETYDFQGLRNETLIIETIKISIFH